ncbi:MAG TPA: histidinol-phosphate transaminase [Candidatus Polarisedimenticolia bacterium]|nr:histidinol-phosphate transaminase [Candidatus Polarisedimenticolia bacterium]
MSPLRVPDNIARIEPYVPGKPSEEVERELGLAGTIKLASNENPLGPSPLALRAARQAMDGVHRYPDGGGYYLRRRLAERLGVTMDQVLLGNGSTDLVEILARTFLGRDGSAMMADQAFIMYRLAVMTVNGNARVIPLHDMRHDLRAMASRVEPGTRIVFIANPNNPTGTYVTHDEFARFAAAVPDDVLIVMDEAYYEYVEAADYPDSLALLKAGRRLAVLRTFSKVYGLAGLRIGYAVTTPDVRAAAEKVRSPFNTSGVAQAAALAALDDDAHVARSREHNARERAYLQDGLRRMGVPFTPSVANFVLVDAGRDAEECFALLLSAGVIVRPMGAYHFPTSLRVTLGTREENTAFLRALEKILQPA